MAFIHFLTTLAIILSFATLSTAQGICSCRAAPVPIIIGGTADEVRGRCISNSCEMGYICPRTIEECAIRPFTTVPYQCEPANTAFSASPVTCVLAGGRDDPHITGFDGTKFDFHGVPHRSYAMFGRVGGDLLVARMRASGYHLWRPHVRKTYFAEFGLQTAGPKVRVAMVPKGLKWTSRVTVDGKPITGTYNTKHASISLLHGGTVIHVATAETKYRFRLNRAESRRHRHLDVEFELLKTPSVVHKYVGLVGMTLNRALGHNIHEGLGLSKDLQVSLRKYGKSSGIKKLKWNHKLEMTMRRFFEVDDLFPPTEKNVVVLSGVTARMLVRARPFSEAVPLRMVASIGA